MTFSKPSRRTTLRTLLGAGTAVFIPAWNETVEAADEITCVQATPTVTEGPYWVDEKLFRSDIRTEPTTGTAREGLPLTMVINVQNLTSSGACSPLVGAYVDIWQCDAKGIYSDVSQAYNPGGGTGSVATGGQKFLRSYQITDANGQVRFTTIYPGWYTSRTIHIHMRVRTYNGTTVLSNFVSQVFFDEGVNNQVLATTLYSRTSSRDTTNATDSVYRTTNNTRMLAAATGDPASGYTATITVGATFQTATNAAPSIATGGVVNALSGLAGVAPGAWISLVGSGLAASTRTVATSDLSGDKLPASLGGVSVQVNGKAAFLQYVSPSQVNALVPSDTSRGTVTVSLTNASGTSSTTTTMADVSPALATLSNYVRAVRSDGAIINGTGNVETGYQVSAGIGPGDILSLYGSGFGAVSPALTDGSVTASASPTTNTVTVTIGGMAANVLWAGQVGAGLYQMNVVVPSALADGDHAVIATVSGVSSQAAARVKVAASAKLSASAGRGAGRLMVGRDLRWLTAVAALHAPDGVEGCLVQVA